MGLTRPSAAQGFRRTAKSPAEAAKLQPDDVILEFNGVPIEDDSHLIFLVSLTEVGKEVPLVIFRKHESARNVGQSRATALTYSVTLDRSSVNRCTPLAACGPLPARHSRSSHAAANRSDAPARAEVQPLAAAVGFRNELPDLLSGLMPSGMSSTRLWSISKPRRDFGCRGIIEVDDDLI